MHDRRHHHALPNNSLLLFVISWTILASSFSLAFLSALVTSRGDTGVIGVNGIYGEYGVIGTPVLGVLGSFAIARSSTVTFVRLSPLAPRLSRKGSEGDGRLEVNDWVSSSMRFPWVGSSSVLGKGVSGSSSLLRRPDKGELMLPVRPERGETGPPMN